MAQTPEVNHLLVFVGRLAKNSQLQSGLRMEGPTADFHILVEQCVSVSFSESPTNWINFEVLNNRTREEV